ncbi:MAG TPA: ATP-binding protein [Opitutaceae bacterium]|nr:ATP-binding protein [Opitutaceae bacterium]
MRNALTAVSPRAIRVSSIERLVDVVSRLKDREATHCVVVDEDDRIVGVVGLQEVASASSVRIFSDLVTSELPPRVLPTASLSTVAQIMGDKPGATVLVYDDEEHYFGLVTKDSLLGVMLAEQIALTDELERMAGEKAKAAQRLEEMVAERTAELRAVVEEMEVFSYSLSHDLRAPLLRIVTYAGMISAEHGDTLPAEVRAHLKRIEASGNHLVTLIRDIQAFVQVSKSPQPVQRIVLSTLVREVLETYRTFLAERGALVETDDDYPPVKGQYSSLFQVLGNLLYNAAKFVAPHQRPHIALRVHKIGDWVRLRVEDKGIGVPDEAQDKLFKPFSRLHAPESYDGTGLGLAFARVAMQRMGGRIGYEPRLGGGSVFWIELPESTQP